jgi:UDP-glucose 6-dehydrogenase
MSSLSDRLGLPHNLFDYVMTVREQQLEWLADIICKTELPKVIMGKTYKPNTNLTAGSPSILLANILKERGEEAIFHDPETDPEPPPSAPSCYIIGTAWPQFKDFKYAKDSTIIDPWGLLPKAPKGCELISIGRRR